MRKDPANYTAGEKKYADLVNKVAKGNYVASQHLKNSAVTLAGDFVIGLTYNRDLQRYSCSAIEIEGNRYNNPMSWTKEGEPLDVDLSPLNLGSVQVGVRTI